MKQFGGLGLAGLSENESEKKPSSIIGKKLINKGTTEFSADLQRCRSE
jgi:hypothetical protein